MGSPMGFLSGIPVPSCPPDPRGPRASLVPPAPQASRVPPVPPVPLSPGSSGTASIPGPSCPPAARRGRAGCCRWRCRCRCPGAGLAPCADTTRCFAVKWVLITANTLARRRKTEGRHPQHQNFRVCVCEDAPDRAARWPEGRERGGNIVQRACLPQGDSNRDSPLPPLLSSPRPLLPFPSPPLRILLLKELPHPCCQMKPFPERAGLSHLGSVRL